MYSRRASFEHLLSSLRSTGQYAIPKASLPADMPLLIELFRRLDAHPTAKLFLWEDFKPRDISSTELPYTEDKKP